MGLTTSVVAVYGLFCIVGGIIGYVKAQSTASLFAGMVSGIVLLICSYGITKGNTPALYISLVVSILLGGRFLITLFNNFKVMPNLIMVILSVITIIIVIVSLSK